MAAYNVEREKMGCTSCGFGKTFIIVGPDGIGGSTTFEDRSDAEDLADLLNIAHDHGHAAASRELPVHVREEMRERYDAELRKDATMPEHIEVLQMRNKGELLENRMVIDVQRACDGRSKLLRIIVA